MTAPIQILPWRKICLPIINPMFSGRLALSAAAIILLAATPLGFAQGTNDPAQSDSHRLDPVTVFGKRPSVHDVDSEASLVGPAQQPEWTARRAFAETDIYVIPSGEIEFNQFYISSHPRHGTPEHLFESEIELGLPWRTQFDVEFNYAVRSGQLQYDSTRIELPHALANWGQIPLNPTVDAGWRFRNADADSFFFRLLLAEELGGRWHLGGNLGFEQQIGGERETDYELNAALSYVAIDRKLAIGAELLVEYEPISEGPDITRVLLGPTLLYKPTRNTHLGLVPLIGLNSDAPVADVFLIFGIDFEPLSHWGRDSDDSGRNDRDFQPVRRPR